MPFSCGDDTECITLNVVAGQLVATLVISPDEGNSAQCTSNGLYVPGGVLAAGNLPANPVDGQEAVYVADDDDGIIWKLKYRDASVSGYKWEYMGGSPLHHKITSLEGLTGAAPAGYVDIGGGTLGPFIDVPLAGDYFVQLDAMIDGAAVGTATAASIRVGNVAASFNDAVANYEDNYVSTSRRVRKNAIAAGARIKMVYTKDSAAAAGFGHRALSVWPIRVA